METPTVLQRMDRRSSQTYTDQKQAHPNCTQYSVGRLIKAEFGAPVKNKSDRTVLNTRRLLFSMLIKDLSKLAFTSSYFSHSDSNTTNIFSNASASESANLASVI